MFCRWESLTEETSSVDMIILSNSEKLSIHLRIYICSTKKRFCVKWRYWDYVASPWLIRKQTNSNKTTGARMSLLPLKTKGQDDQWRKQEPNHCITTIEQWTSERKRKIVTLQIETGTLTKLVTICTNNRKTQLHRWRTWRFYHSRQNHSTNKA